MHVIFQAIKERIPVLSARLLQLLSREQPGNDLCQNAKDTLPHRIGVSVKMRRQLGNVWLHHIWHSLSQVDKEERIRFGATSVGKDITRNSRNTSVITNDTSQCTVNQDFFRLFGKSSSLILVGEKESIAIFGSFKLVLLKEKKKGF